jgi:hypothetical protein
MSSTVLQHIQHLAVTIGPRGSTTPQERQAAEYARARFEALGLETHLEEFVAPRTGWRQFSVAALIGLVCQAIFLFGGRAGEIAAAIVMLLIGASVLLEANFQPNLLDGLMPKGRSQNVWARLPAAGETKRRVLLLAHLDTHRTPWVFTSPRRLAFFRLMTTLGVTGLALAGPLYLGLALAPRGPFHWLTLILVFTHLGVLILTWQPDTTPYTAGANDNASGAAIVLSLAEYLARSPLRGVEVWALCSGCEEVGARGVQDFLRRYKDDLRQMVAINLDNVGGAGAGVCYLSVEGMVFPLRPSSELLGLAEAVKADHPEWSVYPKPFTILGTDATCLMVHRIPALSFVGLTPEGRIPHWHQASDVYENVDAAGVERVEAFVLEMLRRLE